MASPSRNADRLLAHLKTIEVYPQALRPCDVCHALVNAEGGTFLDVVGCPGLRFACGSCRGHLHGLRCDWNPGCYHCIEPEKSLLFGWKREEPDRPHRWTPSPAWLEHDKFFNLRLVEFYAARAERWEMK